MENQKKSFLLYLDAAPVLRQLTAAQRGDLLMALYDYAEQVSRQDVPPGETGLEPAAQAAFLFMAACIRRDSEKWRLRRDGRRQATGRPAAPQGDLSWMKQYINQRDRRS